VVPAGDDLHVIGGELNARWFTRSAKFETDAGVNNHQNKVRIGAGVVVRFGRRCLGSVPGLKCRIFGAKALVAEQRRHR
jgi:hypothetical protein